MPVNTERPVDAIMKNALSVNIFPSEKGPCREIWTIRILNWAYKSIFVLCFGHYRRVFCVASLLLRACILLCFPVIAGVRFVFCSGHYSYAFCVMFRSLQVWIFLCFPVIIDMHFVLCSGHYRHAFYVVLQLLQAYIMLLAPVVTGMHSLLCCSEYRHAFSPFGLDFLKIRYIPSLTLKRNSHDYQNVRYSATEV